MTTTAAASLAARAYPADADSWSMFAKTGPRPRFAAEIEEFPIRLPAGKQLGRTTAVSIAPNGDIFMLHNSEIGHSLPPPETRLPRVVRLSSAGEFLDAWGGPDQLPAIEGVPQWPQSYENIEVDDEGNVWIFGWATGDDALIRFSPEGKLLRQYGRRLTCGGDASGDSFGAPTSVLLDTATRELFVADGYKNHRIISIDIDTGECLGIWGAYGKDPASLSREESFGNPVHKIARAPDGLIYVCDRIKNRVQEFERTSGGLRYRREVVIAPSTGSQGSAFDVQFTPDNLYMFVADGTNGRVWTVNRETMKVLGWHNATPEIEGDYNFPTYMNELHRFARLPSGNLLMARVRPGLQVLKYLGVR